MKSISERDERFLSSRDFQFKKHVPEPQSFIYEAWVGLDAGESEWEVLVQVVEPCGLVIITSVLDVDCSNALPQELSALVDTMHKQDPVCTLLLSADKGWVSVRTCLLLPDEFWNDELFDRALNANFKFGDTVGPQIYAIAEGSKSGEKAAPDCMYAGREEKPINGMEADNVIQFPGNETPN